MWRVWRPVSVEWMQGDLPEIARMLACSNDHMVSENSFPSFWTLSIVCLLIKLTLILKYSTSYLDVEHDTVQGLHIVVHNICNFLQVVLDGMGHNQAMEVDLLNHASSSAAWCIVFLGIQSILTQGPPRPHLVPFLAQAELLDNFAHQQIKVLLPSLHA